MRNLTKADRERGDKLRELGCIVCLIHLELFTEPAIHHIDGKTKKGCHQLTIPLCPNHHQYSAPKERRDQWVSRHGDGKNAFQNAYGTESGLLQQTNERIS